MDLKCKFCDKIFSGYSSRSNHIKKFHNNDAKHIINININKNVDDKPEKDYKCTKCDKSFKYYQSRWRHEQTCKNVNNTEINKKMEIMEEEINKLKKQLEQKTNIINNNYQKANNINNGNIININSLGLENVNKKLTENEKIDLLSCLLFKETPVVEMIRKIYNNDKFIEDRNTIIGNLQSKTCLHYNNETNKFEAKNKNEHIDNMIDYRNKNIKDLYFELQDNKKIKAYTRKLIEEYIENTESIKNTNAYKKNKEEIIYIIYNCKDFMKQLKEELDDIKEIEV